jgi:hypothetical protein
LPGRVFVSTTTGGAETGVVFVVVGVGAGGVVGGGVVRGVTGGGAGFGGTVFGRSGFPGCGLTRLRATGDVCTGLLRVGACTWTTAAGRTAVFFATTL